MQFDKAARSDIDGIIDILKQSFLMSDEEINFLFQHKARLDDCVVCRDNKKVISCLFMFDTYINIDNALVPMYYLYGAATKPEYRNNGYMKKLINFANDLAYKKGQKYSVLLPGSDELYSFYEKLGYKPCFKTKFVNLNKHELKTLSSGGLLCFNKLSYVQMENIRRKIYCQDGDVFRSAEEIKFLAKYNELCKGKTVFSKNGYAVCSIKDKTVEVLDMASDKESFKDLLFNIYENLDAEKYVFRVASDDLYFKNLGKATRFGMIKPLSQDSVKFNYKRAPYLGITLD